MNKRFRQYSLLAKCWLQLHWSVEAITSIFRNSNLVRIALVLTFCIPVSAQTQQDESSQEQESQTPPEEIEIIGQRDILQLRTQLWEVEKQAYDIFNKFNDEKRFHISCRMHEPTGTRIRTQVCQPGFQLEATRVHALQYVESTRAALGGGATNFPFQYQPQEMVIASQQEEYRSKIKQVAEEHPEFRDALIEYSERAAQYEEATRTGE